MPRLLDKQLHELRPLTPLALSLIDRLTPLSTASMALEDADDIHLRAFVEIFTDDGSAGIFRISNRRRDGSQVVELTLQHGLCTLSDHMHPGESTDTGSCRTLLTKILSNQTRWVLGDVAVPDDEELTWECSNTNDLQGLLAVMKELPGYCLDFDQSGDPWVLHVRAKSTEVECEGRFDRNLVDVQVEYDDTDMCTLAYADGLDAPIKADTYDEWGAIARHVSVDENLGADMITQTVERYLEKVKNPRITITLTAIELAKLTGEPFDRFRKGMLCRCILPDMTAVQRIESIERPDPIGEPENVILTLASTQSDLSVTVAGLVVDTRYQFQQIEKFLRIEADTIAMLANEIYLKADRIDLDAYVRMDEFEALIGDFETAFSTYIMTNELDAGTAEIGSLVVTGSAAIPHGSFGTIEIDGVNFSPGNYVTQSDLYGTLSNYATRAFVIDNYVTSSDMATTLSSFAFASDLEALAARVTTLEGKV